MKSLKVSNSKIPLTEVQLAWLSVEGWTTEQLLFVVEHGWKAGVNINSLGEQEHKVVIKSMKVLERMEQARGNAREYDSKNKFQGVNTPSWFRKSFNRDLFK
ncbi:hypothetical protein [Bacillus wiedmannii]|uniref:hypothetical protein n=1 Tax=Bacillus wiedmannii TaxID=1890302 RepID=UPI00115EBA7E|nr:hypothetical protein [Bacillus wiedmannii]